MNRKDIEGTAAFLACAFLICFGRERDVLSIDLNQKIPPYVKTITGSWEKKSTGLSLLPNSQIAVPLPRGSTIRNGSIHVSYLVPIMKKPANPLETDAKECFCALKINAGRYVAEISENGLSLMRMDSTGTYVDSQLGSVKSGLGSPGSEMTLTLSVADRIAVASLNDSVRVAAPVPGFWFNAVGISAYQSPFILTFFSTQSTERDRLIIDNENGRIDILCVCHPGRFNAGNGQHNHSLVTWEKGTAAGNALFTTAAPDSSVYDGLMAIGAVPGNNLTLYPWSGINDPRSIGPDKKTKGSLLNVEVLFAGKSYTGSEIVQDLSGRPLQYRFSGNRNFGAEMHTGCIVCLESCPGGKIGNATYSMRDLVRNIARFKQAPNLPFKEEDEVTVRISLAEKAKTINSK